MERTDKTWIQWQRRRKNSDTTYLFDLNGKEDDAYKKKQKNVKGQQTIKKLVSNISTQTFTKKFFQENMNTFASLTKPSMKTRKLYIPFQPGKRQVKDAKY